MGDCDFGDSRGGLGPGHCHIPASTSGLTDDCCTALKTGDRSSIMRKCAEFARAHRSPDEFCSSHPLFALAWFGSSRQATPFGIGCFSAAVAGAILLIVGAVFGIAR